jgi:hypothetical protein
VKRPEPSYRVVGAMRLCGHHPSFALVVASATGTVGFVLPVMAPNSQKIEGFTALSGTDAADVEPVAGPALRVGDDYVHAFIDKLGGLHLGTVAELRVPFNQALRDRDAALSVKLEIAEQLGVAERTNDLREELVASLSDSFGGHAGRSFENSAARGRLWDIVEGAARDADALARVRKARIHLSARIGATGGLEIQLDAVDPQDLTLSFDEVRAVMAGTFVKARDDFHMPRADLSQLPNSADPTATTILEAVFRSPRQEERLAIMLRSLILYPAPAQQALDRYNDRAQMAKNAAIFLRSATSDIPMDQGEEIRERAVSGLIRRLVTDSYPRRRGVMLYYLAEHLSDFDLVAREIRDIVMASAARDIEVVRERILQAIAKENRLGTERP